MTPMRRSQNWLPYVFNDLFDNDWMIKANSTAPAINVIESDKDYRVEVAAPGMTISTSRSMRTTTWSYLWRKKKKRMRIRKTDAI